MADFPNPNLNLSTRPWLLITETRDLKMGTPANHPVSGFPLLLHWIASGRAAIAMAAVRRGTLD